MKGLVSVCIRRPVFATMLITTLVVVGIWSYARLGVDRFPSVDLPTVTIRTQLPGASSEEMETQVSQVVEEVVNTVEGIDQLRSISSAGSSIVLATFNLERDIDAAAQDVRDRVATILQRLPEDTRPPVVSKFDNDQSPVMTLALSGDRTIRELTEIADKTVKVLLERSTGVGEVRIVGGLERSINVWVDADRLAAYSIPITDLRDAMVRQNAELPGGNVTSSLRESTLRTMGRIQDVEGFRALTVRAGDGSRVRIEDLGRAEDGTKERRSIARLDGRPTVTLEVRRQSGANTMAVIDGVKGRLTAIREALPPGLRLEAIRDQSRYIESALHEIKVHLILGSLLACAVVLIFMRSFRSTLIAGVAIPASVVATFGVMEALGFTLNSVTMLALVLMVGIVIDDAIVVLENVFRFVEEKGLNSFRAAAEGTAEIALAVMATTLSLAVIFVPVSFMSSISGRFLHQFGITAAAAVMVSLLVSFTLTPMMSARLFRKAAAKTGHDPRSRRGFYALIDRIYAAALRLSLRFRPLVLLLAVVVIASTVPLYRLVKQEYTPGNVDEAEFEVNVTAPEGTSLEAMDQAMLRVEDEIRAVRGVTLIQSSVGGSFLGAVNGGSAYVRIEPHEKRVPSITRIIKALLRGEPRAAFAGNYAQQDVMGEIRRRLKPFKELRCSVRNITSFNIGGGSWEIDFSILGPELEVLAAKANELRLVSQQLGGIVDADTTLKLDKPELRVEIDRDRADALGIDIQDVATALRVMVGGDDEVSRFLDPVANESYDVALRLEQKDRGDASRIANLYVPSREGPVRLDNLVRLVPGRSPSRIDRLDRQRQVSLRASVGPGHALADRLAALQKAAQDLGLPPGYGTRISGRGRELERTFDEFVWAFLLSIVLMYIILAAQFESLVHPVTILLSLPLSVPFALLSLHLTGNTLNLYSALGVLVLFGVVKKNSILQIDHMNHLIAAGMPHREAILQANRDRLRPILMTTIALVAGMLPLALGSGPGAEERRTIAVVVIGGQTLSLALTLLVTPVVYSLLEGLRPRRPAAAGEGPRDG